jgi:hypothetical protein
VNLSDRASSSTRLHSPHGSAQHADGASRLLGATIDPAVATAIMAEAEIAGRRKRDPLGCPGPIEFDGTGRIRSLRQEPLSTALASRLEAAGGMEAGEPGIWLHHQPNATTWNISGNGGRNWTHSAVVSPESTSGFVDDALSRGQTVVSGPSGQTSLLASFGKHLSEADPDFPLPDLHLLTLMSLVFDGGHSTEEVLYTLDRVTGRPADGPLRGYEAIARLASSGAESQALHERLKNAFDKTLDYHRKHVA